MRVSKQLDGSGPSFELHGYTMTTEIVAILIADDGTFSAVPINTIVRVHDPIPNQVQAAIDETAKIKALKS